jgi:hypothetical protein
LANALVAGADAAHPVVLQAQLDELAVRRAVLGGIDIDLKQSCIKSVRVDIWDRPDGKEVSLVDRKWCLGSGDVALSWIAAEIDCSRHVKRSWRRRGATIANVSAHSDCTGDRVAADIINDEIGQLKHDGRSRSPAWTWGRGAGDQLAIRTKITVRGAELLLTLGGEGIAASQQRQSKTLP